MHKRKAANHKKLGGADDADGAISHAQLTPRTAVHTLKLLDAITANKGSYTQRIQTVADQLKADTIRPDSLLDLSLVVEGERVRLCTPLVAECNAHPH